MFTSKWDFGCLIIWLKRKEDKLIIFLCQKSTTIVWCLAIVTDSVGKYPVTRPQWAGWWLLCLLFVTWSVSALAWPLYNRGYCQTQPQQDNTLLSILKTWYVINLTIVMAIWCSIWWQLRLHRMSVVVLHLSSSILNAKLWHSQLATLSAFLFPSHEVCYNKKTSQHPTQVHVVTIFCFSVFIHARQTLELVLCTLPVASNFTWDLHLQ